MTTVINPWALSLHYMYTGKMLKQKSENKKMDWPRRNLSPEDRRIWYEDREEKTNQTNEWRTTRGKQFKLDASDALLVLTGISVVYIFTADMQSFSISLFLPFLLFFLFYHYSMEVLPRCVARPAACLSDPLPYSIYSINACGNSWYHHSVYMNRMLWWRVLVKPKRIYIINNSIRLNGLR